MNEHSSKQFDAELDSIRAQVTRMGGLAEEQVRAAMIAFVGGDLEQIAAVVANDKTIDRMEIEIDDACAHIIARRQPTAGDLRTVIAIGKAVTDLERVGDEAKSIAKATRKILERGSDPAFLQEVGLIQLGGQVEKMLREVLDAFVRLDVGAAVKIVEDDEEVDRQFRAIVRQLATYMMEDPRTISAALDAIFIARSLERIGDHCKNVAEDVVYIATGRDVRHIGLEAFKREADGA